MRTDGSTKIHEIYWVVEASTTTAILLGVVLALYLPRYQINGAEAWLSQKKGPRLQQFFQVIAIAIWRLPILECHTEERTNWFAERFSRSRSGYYDTIINGCTIIAEHFRHRSVDRKKRHPSGSLEPWRPARARRTARRILWRFYVCIGSRALDLQ